MENEFLDTEVSNDDYNEDDITESISGLLNNPQPEETEETTAVEAPVETEYSLPTDYKIKVKVNGQEQEVTLDELKNGYQRQSDYTQKTQEVAQQKQALSQQENEYNQYLQSIPMLAQVAQANIQDATNRLYDPEFTKLATEDPAQYIAEKAKLEKIVNQNQVAAQNMVQQYNQYQQQEIQRQQDDFNRRLVHANEVLSKTIEGWDDGSVLNALRDFATKTIGFEPHELNGLIDPRQVIVLDKARRYDELMKSNTITQKQVVSKPSKTLKPGTATTTTEQDEFKAKQKQVLASGNDRDIASLMAQLL